MRYTLIASAAIATLLLGGCNRPHRQTHVFVPGVEDRAWWYPSTDRNLARIYQADQVGRMAWINDEPSIWDSGSVLAASDALGGASFYDTTAYVEARRLERQDAAFANAPTD